MPNLLEVFGESPKEKGSLQKTLFNFFLDIPIYPFDETYEVRDNKGKLVYTVTKKGMSMALFNSLITQLSEKNKKEKEEYDKANRRR